jgi:hypothetical protein
MENDKAKLDEGFFAGDESKARTRNGLFAGRNMQYGFQRSLSGDGRMLSQKERNTREETSGAALGKKHFKGRDKK